MKRLPASLACAVACLTSLCGHGAERLEVEATTSRENLDNGYADWSSSGIDAEYRDNNGDTLYGALRETKRFDQRDGEIMLGHSAALSGDDVLILEGNASPSHKVLPRYSAFVGLLRKLSEGWNVQGGLRRTAYDNADTTLGNLGVERYWGSYRAAFTLYAGHLRGAETLLSSRLQADYYYGRESRIGIAFADGREAENVGTAGVLVSDTRQLALVGSHWLSDRVAFTYAFTKYRQGSLYTRHGLELGIRGKF